MRRASAWLLSLVLVAGEGCGRTIVADDGGASTPTADGGSGAVADPVEHCINERFWKCRRDLAGGRIDEPEYNECLEPIMAVCSGAMWPPGCAPTPARSSVCIELLASASAVSIPTDELLASRDECDLCP